MKCDTCKVIGRINASADPSACKWFMDHVVCGDESVDKCPDYEPMKKQK